MYTVTVLNNIHIQATLIKISRQTIFPLILLRRRWPNRTTTRLQTVQNRAGVPRIKKKAWTSGSPFAWRSPPSAPCASDGTSPVRCCISYLAPEKESLSVLKSYIQRKNYGKEEPTRHTRMRLELTLLKTLNDSFGFPTFANSGLNSDGSSIVIRFSNARFELWSLVSLLGILKRRFRCYELSKRKRRSFCSKLVKRWPCCDIA